MDTGLINACFGALAVAGVVSTSVAARADDVAPVVAARADDVAPVVGTGRGPEGVLATVPGGLVADAVAAAAMTTSHEARAKDFEVQAAEAGVRQAWLGYFPRFSVAATYTRLSPIVQPVIGVAADGSPIRFPVFLDSGVVQGSLAVPLTDLFLRIPQAYASAKNAANAAKFNAEATRLQAAVDARTLYYNWLRTRLSGVVATLALEQTKAHLGVAVAHASPADIARVESQVAAMELVVEKTKNLVSVTEDRLRSLMHDTSGKAYELGESVEEVLPAFSGLELRKLWEEARNQRLEVKAVGELVLAQRFQERVATAGLWPRLDAVANVTTANPNQRIFPQVAEFRTTWDVSLRLSWSPNDAAASAAGGAAVDARAASFEAQRSALLDGLRAEVTGTYTAVREADFAVGATSRGLKAAEDSYRIRSELFKVGRATSVELLDAEAELTRARIDALGARVDQRIARARLAHAVGRDAASASGKGTDGAALVGPTSTTSQPR